MDNFNSKENDEQVVPNFQSSNEFDFDVFSDQFQSLSETQEVQVPFPGLQNLGNTCFFNSVMQILFYCPFFYKKLLLLKTGAENIVKFFQQNDAESENEAICHQEKENCLFAIELIELYAEMAKTSNMILDQKLSLNDKTCVLPGSIRPEKLLTALRKVYSVFEPYTQQDAQECLSCIRNILQDVTNHINGFCASKRKKFNKDPKLLGGTKTGVKLVTAFGSTSQENKNPLFNGPQKSNTYHINKKTSGTFKSVLQNFNKNIKNITHLPQSSPQTKSYNKLKSSYLKNNASENTVTSKLGCYERFKRKRYTNTSEKYSLKENGKVGNCDGSPPSKRKRTALNLMRMPHNGLKSKRALDLKFIKIKKRDTNSTCKPANNTTSENKPSTFIKLRQNDLIQDQFKVTDNPLNSAEEIVKVTSVNDIISNLFEGQITTVSKCMECENIEKMKEPFMDLSLPVKDLNESSELLKNIDNKGNADDESVKYCTLSWALSEFTSSEIMDGENKYFCNKCDRLVEAKRTLQFSSLPSILTIHLKRFTAQAVGGGCFFSTVSKNNIPFHVPKTMCLKDWCSEQLQEANSEYKLFGIIVHRGTTMSSGHYLSYVHARHTIFPESSNKSSNWDGTEFDDVWLQTDDEKVKILSDDELNCVLNSKNFDGIVSHTPYLLFYHKVNIV